MPITFACDCGKQLKTGDENAGKRVKCPACGQAVAVPAPGAAKAPTAGVVRFGCDCGRQLQARPELAGKRVKCPGCGAELTVPGGGNGIQANKPAAKLPRPKPIDDEDEPPRKGKRRFAEDEADAPRKARRRLAEDEAEDDEDEEELPRRGKKKASKGLSVPLVLGITAAVILLLTGGGIGAYFLFFRPDEQKPVAQGPGPDKGGEQNQQQQGGPVADLDFVPRNAVGFGAIRVAKLLDTPAGKLLSPLLNQWSQGAITKMEQATGLRLADVERATVVLPSPDTNEGILIVTLSKPYDKDRILKLLGPAAQQKEVQGKTVHAAGKEAVHFAGDRMIVGGGLKELEQLFGQMPKPDDTGPLSEAIKLAAEDHHLVVSGNLPAELMAQAKQKLPAELKPFEPLAELTGFLASGSLTDDLQLDVRLHYADEGKAQKAKEAGDGAVALAKIVLAQQKQQAAKDPKADKEMAQVFEQAEKLLQQLTVRQEKANVQLSLKTEGGVGQLLALVPVIMRQFGGAANSAVSSNNLKQLALAMHNYHNDNRRLPTGIRAKDGQPLLSWRVELLPYLEQDELYKQFKLDESWDSPHNKALLAKMPKVFADPERPSRTPGLTFYQVFCTPPGQPYDPLRGAPFPGPTMKTPPRPPALRLANFVDGTSITILIAEGGSAVPWTRPQDIPYNPKEPIPPLGNPAKKGFFVAMADGVVLMVPRTVSEATLRNAITAGDGTPLGPDWPKR